MAPNWKSLIAALGAAVIVALGPATDAAGRDLTVVELFTSQGCSSCPPADAILGELSDREDVLALSLHVAYWDYLGWKDPFASAEHAGRQREYARRFGLHYVYTPQMVIQGSVQVTGSDRARILAGIKESRGGTSASLRLGRRDDGGLTVDVVDAPAEAMNAMVWIVVYDHEHVSTIEAGENRGQTLRYRNVVTGLRPLGAWRGEELVVPAPLANQMTADADYCAALIQSAVDSRILGAATLSLEIRR
ncbi:MAG: DUF1223 domain-containing protein [Rhodospirillales bacterium]|jgi:hypothetical protein|nr:DUF1223 domain-containing protein [Rhodospirillales bacterium]